jgi:hypothetical protein
MKGLVTHHGVLIGNDDAAHCFDHGQRIRIVTDVQMAVEAVTSS